MSKRKRQTFDRQPRDGEGQDSSGGRRERGGREGGGARRGGPGGALWLFGRHAVVAALGNPARRVLRLLATAESVAGLTPPKGVLAEVVDRRHIDEMTPPGAVHQGIAAQVTPLEPSDIADLPALVEGRENAVVLVLDQLTDPHNVGAILRSAAAFGALAVIMQDRHAPEESGTLAKAASGALEVVPIIRATNISRTLEYLNKELDFWAAGLDADGDKTIAEAGLSGRIALVLGAEGAGLRRMVAEHCHHLVRLPMTGAVESLNVSNACAVALYELLGRRL